MTTALDDRITAAVPVVGTSDFGEQIQVCRPLDWYHAAEYCHFVPGLLSFANNHELLAMAARRPVLIVAAEHDEVRGVLVCVDDRGKEALAADPIVWRAFRRGWAVCGIDPRGTGESASSKKGWTFAVSLFCSLATPRSLP
jgi:hypothetical protein